MALQACHISTFPPTQCGIATYVSDLVASLTSWNAAFLRMTFSVDRPANGARLEADTASRQDYEAAADAINSGPCDVVSLQHEFGIFGGEDGEYVIDLVERIQKPVVATLHTVSPQLSARKAWILERLVRSSKRIVVLSEESASVLCALVGIGTDRIDVISHGVPEIKFRYPEENNLRRSLNARTVFVSAGHVRPAKGYDVALAALAILKRSYGDFKYLILGRVQPQYKYGVAYPGEIEELIDRLGLKDNVIWVQEYLRFSELIDHISAGDVGLVTYTEEDHASSGILPLMLASGRPVVATAFAYAVRMARHTPSIHLAPMNDPERLCRVIHDSIRDAESLRADMLSAHLSTRPFIWSRIGEQYDRVLRAAVS